MHSRVGPSVLRYYLRYIDLATHATPTGSVVSVGFDQGREGGQEAGSEALERHPH